MRLDGLNQKLKNTIETFIRRNWRTVTIDHADGNASYKQGTQKATLLIVNDGTQSSEQGTTLGETVIVTSESPKQVLFLVNAKLGRLTNSGSAGEDQQASMKSSVSRREFLFAMLKHRPPLADAPVVAADVCEARFGCRKCVEVCPASGALEVLASSLVVLKERCVRCGLCASICPVAAIQVPEMTENAYRGLLNAINDSSSPKKTLVITCNESSVPKQPWMDVEQVHAIGVIGVRQLAMAASTSIGATIVYCADGSCVGKERVRQAAELLTSITKTTPPLVYYVEGRESAAEIVRIHNSAQKRDGVFILGEDPWKGYVKAIEHLSAEGTQVGGLGLTDMQVAESCTLCNACVDKCPHKALAVEMGSLVFNSAGCTGCGYCEQICPEHSITLRESKHLITFARRSVFKDEMIECSKCNTPFASAKMVRKVSALLQTNTMISICPSCRERGMYDELFRNSR